MFMPIADPSISLEENTRIAAAPERGADEIPRGGVRRRQGRARGHVDGSGAPEHDRDGRSPETARAVARRDDARPPARRDGASSAASRRVEHLDDADHQPHRHADDRHSVGGRRQGVRQRSRSARSHSRDALPTSCVGVPGASNVYPEQVTSGQYLNIDVDRAAAARYGIGVGDVQQVIETADRRDRAHDNDRRPRAVSCSGSIRARVSRRPAGARRRARGRHRTARRSRWSSSRESNTRAARR